MPIGWSSRSAPFFCLFLIVCLAFPFAARAAYSPSVPSRWLLNVRETAGVARSGEVVRSGVPVPRSLGLRGTASLAVVDAAGTPVPAEFEVTARWNSGRNDPNAPIQWLLVSFPATVGANATAAYRIVADGSVANPAPARPLTLTQSGNAVTVDTGAAVFRLGASAGALFDEIVLDDGTRLVGGGALTVEANGAPAGHSTIRKVWIESSGPLAAVVVVEGAYDVAPIGNGQISTLRRYVFTAGSPTAVVRHVVTWEGNLACNGCTKTTAGDPNGVLVGRTRDTLSVELGGTPTVTAVGAFAAPALSGSVAAGGTAAVRQLLRPSRTAPMQLAVNVGGATAGGAKADGGILAASGPRGAVAIGLAQMHRYEPQALRLLADGSLAIDVVDDKAWLAHHQGLFATLAVTALPAAPSRPALDRLVWAPLNRPLHAWPEAAWFAASDAVEELPVGTLPAEFASYDTLMTSVLARTEQQMDLLGLPGLMTFGVYPRYWGKTGAPGEVDCSGTNDPTPNETWDNLFWCGTWTDYHNTVSAVPYWAMRTGDVEWLDELAFPGALRTLHTQIMQCSPTEKWFYCGQAPAGYNAYRSDFNSSHAYFENLYLYYWLTGDYTVVKTLQRGADSMRRFMCSKRGPSPVTEPHGPDGPACGATDPVNPNASMTGRVGSQWIAAFHFVGLASDDASFLDDFRGDLARAYTQQYAELDVNGVRAGLLGALISAGSPFVAQPILQENLYDATNLFRLLRDTGDAPIGSPALTPSHLLRSLARGMTDVEMKVIGDGTPEGRWPHGIAFTFTGERIGGTLATMAPDDRDLYTPEKTTAVALLVRAGELGNDSFLLSKGRELVQFTLSAAIGEGAPLGKLHGQYLQRLPSAIARLAAAGSVSPPPPPPPPTVTVPAAPSSLTGKAVSASQIQLNWKDNSTNEATFRVEQLINGVYSEIAGAGANVTTCLVGGLKGGTAYTFRVRAASSAGFSAYSNTVKVTTLKASVQPPAAPSSFSATYAGNGTVHFTWTDNSSNEDNFRIEQMVNGVYKEVLVTGANVTTVSLPGLRDGASYNFRMRASNTAGNSAYSNGDNVNMF